MSSGLGGGVGRASKSVINFVAQLLNGPKDVDPDKPDV